MPNARAHCSLRAHFIRAYFTYSLSSSGAEKLLHSTEGLDDFGQEFSDFLCTGKSIDCSLKVGSIALNLRLVHTTEES